MMKIEGVKKKTKSQLLLSIVVLIYLFFPIKCFAFDDGDFQAWYAMNFSWKIKENWKFAWEKELRFGDDVRDHYYFHADLGVTYSGFAKWLDVGIYYRQVFEEKSLNWTQEYQPHLDATLKFDIGEFKINNRGRLEFRNKKDSDFSLRYRNKFTVKFPFKLTRLKIQPYIADEIFADFDAGEMNRNRLYVGLVMDIVQNLKMELFYLWQTSKSSGNWDDLNILGTKLKFSF